MLDIKQEIEILLLKKRLSMRKIVTLMKEAGYDIPQQSTVSTAFNNKTVYSSLYKLTKIQHNEII